MKEIIVQISDSKGNHRDKIFDVDPNPKSKSVGYMVGYIQACQDHGYNVTMIDK